MLLNQIISWFDQVAPPHLAEGWDNVGLLVGDPDRDVRSAMLTIDYTPGVAEEGKRLGVELVVAYHPPIFQPIKRINAGGVVFDAIARGVAIYSPHTALDVAEGGTNDVLCEVLGLRERSALKAVEAKASQMKLATFVPEDEVEKVSAALFAAGAGQIGNYTMCSFRSPGVGTFFGQEGTNPAVGRSGRLERTPEVRVETVVPVSKLSDVITALRQSHSYEEPAFDLYPLTPGPLGLGLGRIGEFAQPIAREALLERIKQGLSLDHLLVAGPTHGEVKRAAVCAGACGELLNDALAQRADLLLTGEVRHHDALRAAAAGMTVVCTLHSNSERITLGRLKDRLAAALPGLAIHLSQADRDPYSIR